MTSIDIVELPGFDVVGVRVNAAWDELHSKVPAAWRDVFEKIPLDEGFLEVSVDVVNGTYTELVGVRRDALVLSAEKFETLRVPANRWLHLEHRGPQSAIATSFGRLYEYARDCGVVVGDLKFDEGYTRAGDEHRHDLYLAVEPAAKPQWMN